MGTEAAWIPAVISLVAAGANQYNTSQTAKKRDADIAQGIRDSSKQQDKANQKIDQNLDSMEDSRALPFKQDLTQQFLEKIQKHRQQGLVGLNTAGATSDAYDAGAANAKTGAVDYAGNIASLLAGIDAAGNQRQTEGIASNDLGMDIKKLGRNADQDSFLAQLRAARHRDNPWIAMAASGLSGYASGMNGYGGVSGGPAATGSVNPNGVTFPAQVPIASKTSLTVPR